MGEAWSGGWRGGTEGPAKLGRSSAVGRHGEGPRRVKLPVPVGRTGYRCFGSRAADIPAANELVSVPPASPTARMPVNSEYHVRHRFRRRASNASFTAAAIYVGSRMCHPANAHFGNLLKPTLKSDMLFVSCNINRNYATDDAHSRPNFALNRWKPSFAPIACENSPRYPTPHTTEGPDGRQPCVFGDPRHKHQPETGQGHGFALGYNGEDEITLSGVAQ